MTVNLENSTVGVYLTSPSGEVALGEFSVDGGQVGGTDHRGIAYRGTCTALPDGSVQVEVTATVPAGTRAGDGSTTEADAEQKLAFFLSPDQVAGRRTKPILLPGFGLADVRFEAR
jgi:hypothetical protein